VLYETEIWFPGINPDVCQHRLFPQNYLQIVEFLTNPVWDDVPKNTFPEKKTDFLDPPKKTQIQNRQNRQFTTHVVKMAESPAYKNAGAGMNLLTERPCLVFSGLHTSRQNANS